MPVFCPQDFQGLHVHGARTMKTAPRFPLIDIDQLQADQLFGLTLDRPEVRVQ